MKVTFRRSQRSDLALIHQWLKDEDARGIPGNFLCNWNLVEESGGKDLFVAVADGEIVGFQWGRLLRSGILQIRYEWRRKGVGRGMVDYLCRLNIRNGERLLSIECKPHSSIPFWRAMGFTIHQPEPFGKAYAYKVLNQRLRLPKAGEPVRVSVSFYPNAAQWDKTVPPIVVVQTQGKRIASGQILLSEAVSFHEKMHDVQGDTVVKIEVNSASLYWDKAKYEGALALGVRRCRNGWRMNSIQVGLMRSEI